MNLNYFTCQWGKLCMLASPKLGRIFRGGVHTQQRDRAFLRPTPTHPSIRELTSTNTDRVKGERDGWYVLRPARSIG
jgi:hypothetical protein